MRKLLYIDVGPKESQFFCRDGTWTGESNRADKFVLFTSGEQRLVGLADRFARPVETHQT